MRRAPTIRLASASTKGPKLQMLKPGVRMAPEVTAREAGAWRAGKTTAERGYGGRWQRAREEFLLEHPLCVKCQEESPPRTTPATVVDHRIPHQGDQSLFWDRKNWQPLCAHHHSSDKQREERGGHP